MDCCIVWSTTSWLGQCGVGGAAGQDDKQKSDKSRSTAVACLSKLTSTLPEGG